jgi:hypothetical protein
VPKEVSTGNSPQTFQDDSPWLGVALGLAGCGEYRIVFAKTNGTLRRRGAHLARQQAQELLLELWSIAPCH